MLDQPGKEALPTIAIILIFLDSGEFIAEAIESVLAQTFTDWELALVDDGSSDGSTGIAKDYAARDRRIRYVEHPGHANRGMSASRNLGARATTAPLLAFLDSDDVMEPDKLDEELGILTLHPDVAMVCGASLYWRSWQEGGKDEVVLTGGVADQRIAPPQALLQFYPLGSAPGGPVTVMIRREVFDAIGGFEESFPGLFEDQALLVKLYLEHPIFIIGRPLFRYRQHDNSCCATTLVEAGEYERKRAFFLEWLDDWVRARGIGDRAVKRAIRNAKLQVKYARLRALARRGRARIREMLRPGTP
jgi:glycosyltransferase involved in cell wall biosynthesis